MKVALILAAVVFPVVAHAENRAMPAWEWSDADRISLRCDSRLAAERVAESKPESRTSRAGVEAAPERTSRIVDVIDGKKRPELFLPTELFEALVERGLLDGWGEGWEKRIRAAGLPDDFLRRLRKDSELFIADLEERRQLTRKTPDAPERARLVVLAPALCRDRADALQRATRAFGPDLSRFMYVYVAPLRTTFLEEPADPEALTSRERGCR
jgi:hypothetical protein